MTGVEALPRLDEKSNPFCDIVTRDAAEGRALFLGYAKVCNGSLSLLRRGHGGWDYDCLLQNRWLWKIAFQEFVLSTRHKNDALAQV